jgi:3-oxoacyl-[acyl-carrier protein] reductase
MAIAGKAVVVAGGAGHLGRAVVDALLARGARVAVLDRDPEGASRLADRAISYHIADTALEDETAAALEAAATGLDGFDALVNCAGLIYSEPLINLLRPERRRHGLDSWNVVLRANLTTAFVLGSLAAERMALARTKGVIVNLSSVAAAGNAGQSAYSAAKAGLEALTVAWGKELGLLGIRVVAIAPGFVDTPSTRETLGAGLVKDWVRRTPLRRLGSTESVSGAVLFALENDFVTGCTIRVDGGVGV